MFWKRRKRKQEGDAPKVFIPPADVKSALELYTRLACYSFCSEINVTAYTEDKDGHKKGDIFLRVVERDAEFHSLLKAALPEVYAYLYNNPEFDYGYVQEEYPYFRQHFFEPECYLFDLPKEAFQQWAKKLSQQAFVWDYWTISSPMRIRLTSSEYQFDMRMYRFEQFVRYVKKHCMR